MTDTQIIAVVAGVVVVVVVLLLKGNTFNLKGNKKGFAIDNKPAEQRPGVSVEGAVARKGSVNIENNQGDGVAAKALDAAKDINVRNNPGPKP